MHKLELELQERHARERRELQLKLNVLDRLPKGLPECSVFQYPLFGSSGSLEFSVLTAEEGRLIAQTLLPEPMAMAREGIFVAFRAAGLGQTPRVDNSMVAPVTVQIDPDGQASVCWMWFLAELGLWRVTVKVPDSITRPLGERVLKFQGKTVMLCYWRKSDDHLNMQVFKHSSGSIFTPPHLRLYWNVGEMTPERLFS